MSKSLILSVFLCGVALAYASAPKAATDPSVHQIYEAAQSGRIADAEQMVDQVLQDNPRSGKAHYVAAEIYARAGNFPRARSELAAAEQINPGLSFVTDPTSVSSLKRELAANHVTQGFAGGYARPQSASGLPWGGILLALIGIGVVWMLIRRRVQASSYGSYPGNIAPGPGQPGYGAPGGGPYYPGGGGSGLMGSLGTGLAIGAGVAAGEELVHHVFDGDRTGGVINSAGASELGNLEPQNSNMGGEDFGVGDSNSWSDSSGSDGGSFDAGVGGDDWT